MNTFKKQKRISDEQFKRLLIKELSKPDNNANLKTNFYQLLQTNYSIDKTRALKLHDKYYKEYQDLKNNKLMEQTINAEKEAIILDLNNKNKHAQELLEDIKRLQEIKAGKFIDIKGTLITATYTDEIRAKSEIRAIRAQVGKWYGFDAPTKHDVKVNKLGVEAMDEEYTD